MTVLVAALLGTALIPGPALVVAEHLGALHGYERLLVAVVALGPFLVAGVVVQVVRKRDIAAEEDEARTGTTGPEGPD